MSSPEFDSERCIRPPHLFPFLFYFLRHLAINFVDCCVFAAKIACTPGCNHWVYADTCIKCSITTTNKARAEPRTCYSKQKQYNEIVAMQHEGASKVIVIQDKPS